MENKNIIKITLIVLIISLFTLFSYVNIKTSEEYYIICPNGTTELYDQDKIIVCGKIQSQLIITFDDILEEKINLLLKNVTENN